jgi:micrococcal nuclease
MSLSLVVLVVPAIVLGVVDGDTVHVRAFPWTHGFTVDTNVRIEGIDTPEVKGHARCASEATLGDTAKKLVAAEFVGKQVALYDVQQDKYGDRVLASVIRADDGVDLATMMLGSGLARPYTGSGPKPNWCPV